MGFFSSHIISESSPEETKELVVQGYDNKIKNEFYISESFIESDEEKDKIYITVKVFRYLRKGIPSKYEVKIKSEEEKTIITLSTYTLFIRLTWLFLIIIGVYFIERKPFLGNTFIPDSLILLLCAVFLSLENLKERNTIIKAIKKTLIK